MTTDLGGNVAVSRPPAIDPLVKVAGFTRSGASKLLCESIADAVRIRPDTVVPLTPVNATLTVAK